MDFSGTKALTFDCYGTLIDWEKGILSVLGPWAAANSVSASDDELLESFGRAEAAAERERPSALYREILRSAMHGIAREFGMKATAAEADTLAHSVGDWPAFPDTVSALQELKKRFRLVIVSNVDHESFAGTSARLQVALDAVVTAQDVGAYKPDHRMFERAFAVLEGLGVGKGEILHVAQSLYHDHVPAKTLGMRTVWVDRRQGKGGGATCPPVQSVTPDLVVTSLAEFAGLALGN